MPVFLPLLGGMAGSLGAGFARGMLGKAIGGRLGKAFFGKDEESSNRIGYESGRLAGIFSGLAISAITLSKALEGAAHATLRSRQDMARFNSSISSIFAQVERQEIQLAVRTAQGSSGSTVALGKAFMELRQEQQPWEEIGVRAKNIFGIVGYRLRTSFLEMIGPFRSSVEKYLDKIERAMGISNNDGRGFQGEARQFFRQYSRGQWGNPQNREPGDER